MSQTIDNRVVQMEFDNESFEKGVRTSLTSLEELKKGLDLDKATKSIQALERTFEGFDLSPLADAVDTIADRFSVMGIIATAALEQITDRAVTAGLNIAHSFSFEAMTSGFSKYEKKMEATQSIQNATGLSVKEINEELEKLIDYSDETSYSFSDLSGTMATFIQSGLEKSKAAEAVEGIANACADAGIGIHNAQTAFQVFAKAMTQGKMTYNQYQSLELMRFATDKFNNVLIETAKEVGTIDAKTGKVVGKAKGEIVTLNNLTSTLHDGWLNNEVMYKSLQKYMDQETEFGRQAYAAAQNAKTFTDVIDSVKDALGTGWMITYENVFGDLDVARKNWTDLANFIIETLGNVAEWRNKVTAPFGELGVTSDFFKSIFYFGSGLRDLIGSFAEGASRAFPIFGSTMNRYMNGGWWGLGQGVEENHLTIWADKTAEKIRDTLENVWVWILIHKDDLTDIFAGILTPLGMVSRLMDQAGKSARRLLGRFKPLASPLVRLGGEAGRLMQSIAAFFEDNQIFHSWAENVTKGFKPLTDKVPVAAEWLDRVRKEIEKVSTALDGGSTELRKLDSPLARIIEGFISFGNILSNIWGFVNNVFSQIVAAIAPHASDFIGWVLDMAASLGEWIKKVDESGVIADTLQTWSDKIGGAIITLEGWADAAWEWIGSTGIIEAIKTKFDNFNRWLTKTIYGRTEAQQVAIEQLDAINKLENSGNVDLVRHPTVSLEYMKKRGWESAGELDTLFTQTFTKDFGDRTISFGITPIMPDGHVLNERGLANYVEKLVSFGDWDKALAFDKDTKKGGHGIILPWFEVPNGSDSTEYRDQVTTYFENLREIRNDMLGVGGEEDEIAAFTEKINEHTEGVGLAQKALDGLHTALTNLANWFNTNSISGMLNDFFGGLKTGFDTVFGKLAGFLTADTSNEKTLTGKLNARLDAMKDLGEDGQAIISPLNTIIGWIQNVNTFVGSIISDTLGLSGDTIGSIFNRLGTWLGDFIGSFAHGALSKIKKADMLKMAAFCRTVIPAVLDIKWGSEFLSTLTEFIDNINTTLKGGEGEDFDIFSSVRLKRIAMSIALIAGGLFFIAWAVEKLASVPPIPVDYSTENGWSVGTKSGLGAGLFAVWAILQWLSDFYREMGALSSLEKGGTEGIGKFFGIGNNKLLNSVAIAVELLSVGGAIWVLASAVEKLSNIPFVGLNLDAEGNWTKNGSGLVGGLGGLFVVFKILEDFFAEMKALKLGSISIPGAFQLLPIAWAVSSLADSVKMLSDIKLIGLAFKENGSIDFSKSTTDGMATGLFGLFMILQELAFFMSETSGLTLLGGVGSGLKVKALASAVHSLASSVKMLSDIELIGLAFKENGHIDYANSSTKGLAAGLSGLFAILGELAWFMSQTNGINLMGATKFGTLKITALAGAVHSLAESVVMLSDIKLINIAFKENGSIDFVNSGAGEGLFSGLVGLFMILEELAFFMEQTGDINLLGETKFGTFKLMAIAEAVKILADSVKELSSIKLLNDVVKDAEGNIDWLSTLTSGGEVTGIAGLFGIMAGLATFMDHFNEPSVSGSIDTIKDTAQGPKMNGLGKAATKVISGLQLTEFANAVGQLSDSMVKLSGLQLGGVVTGLFGVGGSAGIMYAFLHFFEELGQASGPMGTITDLISTGKVLVFGEGMNLMADAITKLGGLKWEELGGGLGAMAGSMVAAGVGPRLFKDVSIADIGKMLIDIGAMLAGFTALFTGLQSVIDFVEDVINKDPTNKTWTVVGKLEQFGETLRALGSVFGSFFGGLVGGFLGSKNKAENITEDLGTEDIINALAELSDVSDAIDFDTLEKLEDQIDRIRQLGGSLVLDNGDHFFVDVATPIYDLSVQLGDLNTALTNLGPTVDSFAGMRMTVFSEISNVLGNIAQVGTSLYTASGGTPQGIDDMMDVVDQFFNRLAYGNTPLGQITAKLAYDFTVSYESEMQSHEGEVKETGWSVAGAAIDGAAENYDGFTEIGAFLVDGLIAGIQSKAAEVSSVMSSLVSTNVVGKAKSDLAIASPSKVFEEIGGFISLGMARGIGEYSDAVKESSISMTSEALAGARAFGDLSEIITDGFDTDPVIRPIMDLSSIRSGATSLEGILDGSTKAARNFSFADTFNMPNLTVEGNNNIVSAIGGINERLEELSTAVTNMQIILDTGVMVGQMAPAMDQQLGARMTLRERGA